MSHKGYPFVCQGCDWEFAADESDYMPGCGCLLCEFCYIESFEENDMYCVGENCPSCERAVFDFEKLNEHARWRGYIIGDRDLAVKVSTSLGIDLDRLHQARKDPRYKKILDKELGSSTTKRNKKAFDEISYRHSINSDEERESLSKLFPNRSNHLIG